MYAFFPEFKLQMQPASMNEVLRISNAIIAADRKMNFVFVNKVSVMSLIDLFESQIISIFVRINRVYVWFIFVCGQ